MRDCLTYSLTIAAMALLGLNVYGCLRSLRSSYLWTEHNTIFENDVILSYEEVLDRCERRPEEPDDVFVGRVCEAIHDGMAHIWMSSKGDTHHLQVPIWENYLLAGYLWVRPPNVGYEYLDHRKALERGIGLCSQHVIAATGVLSSNGITARPVHLHGHMVALIERADGSHYIIDPDFGVVLPFDLETVERNPELVVPYYMTAHLNPDSLSVEDQARRMVKVYRKDGNVVYASIADCWGWEALLLEKGTYFAKWTLPLGLMVLAGFVVMRNRERTVI